MAVSISEQDGSGHVISVYDLENTSSSEVNVARTWTNWAQIDWSSFLKSVFLPAGFPGSVSSDYTEVQIYNGLQAFCSSVATLIASRAVLEGHGIGNADASATHAVLLTVLQDAFSRLTTIIGAYYLGTLLYPEAKSYRLVADVTNDIAIVFDLLSPGFAIFSLSTKFPFIFRSPGSSLRIIALCLSGAFRALCGVAAGGAKAAITLHFAQDGTVLGDVGDLSAKDASKETVLALAGMLCGSMLMPHLYTPERTHTVVAILLVLHVWINYVAVRVTVMKTLNRQRATILWAVYNQISGTKDSPPKLRAAGNVLTPPEIASREHLFGRNSALLRYQAGQLHVIGRAIIGGSFTSLMPKSGTTEQKVMGLHQLLDIFSDKQYIIGLDTSLSIPQVSIVLKEGHNHGCHLEAWVLANTIASRATADMTQTAVLSTIEECKVDVGDLYDTFVADITRAGWRVDTNGILTGSARTIQIRGADDRKSR